MKRKASEPCRKFMFHNLLVDPPDQEMSEVIAGKLAEIGFELACPRVKVEASGPMPDSEARAENRFWVTFSVDSQTAGAIRNQRHGRNAQIEKMNEGLEESPEKRLKLKQYKGLRFEAVKGTIGKAARILSKSMCPPDAGFHVEVFHDYIQVEYDGTTRETITIESLIEDHRDVFEKAISGLSRDGQEVMRRMVEKMEKKAEKQALDDLTLSIADTSSTATLLKRVRFSGSALSSPHLHDPSLVLNLSPIGDPKSFNSF